MNIICYILRYIIMIMIFFIVIKSIYKSKNNNITLINIIMFGIIVNYFINILEQKKNIKEKFNSNIKYLDNNEEESEELNENNYYLNFLIKEKELNKIKKEKKEMCKRELDIKKKELEILKRELEEKTIREKENELIKKEEIKSNKYNFKKDNINDCNKRKNSIWGENYDNDLEYNELPKDMMEPLGKIDTSYTYMPPWKWWPPRKNPPMCSREAKCSPCPITTMGTPTDVKEWDNSRYVTPGLGINIPYIEKLNRQYNEK